MKKIVSLLFLLCLSAFAQDIGTSSYESWYPLNHYLSINLGNGNLMVQAPIHAKGGPVPLSLMLSQNNMLYYSAPFAKFFTTAQPSVLIGYPVGGLVYTYTNPSCNGHTDVRYFITGLKDGNGTLHPIAANWSKWGCTPAVDAFTTDNTGIELVIPVGTGQPMSGAVYDRAGMAEAGGSITDPHGNTLTAAYNGTTLTYADLLTSTPVISYPALATFGSDLPFTYTDGTGTQQSVTATFLGGTNGITVVPPFNCPGYNDTSSGTHPLSTVSWPNGSTLSLGYEQVGGNYTGRLGSVTVPTGGTYSISYTGGTNNDGWWCGGAGNATISVSDGTGTWTVALNSGHTQTTVTKPDGSVLVYSFSGANDIPTAVVTKDTDGSTVLDTETICYDSTISSCNPIAPTQHPTWIRSYRTVPGVSGNSEVDTKVDTYGNVTEVDRYGFGPTLVKKTITQYGSWNGSTCAAISHIQNRPCDVQVQDAASNVLSHSKFAYNSTGDLLNEYDYYNSFGNYLTTTYTYNSNGTLASSTAPDGVQTTFAYNGTGGCPSSAPALLPTSATNNVGTVSTTWDCNGAVPLTTTDLNGLVTTTTYGDPLYRPTEISDNGGHAPVTFTYTSSTQSSTDMTFNSGNSIADTTTTLDSLGRVLSVQSRQSPTSSNYDTVSFAYDSSGHPTSVSVACVTTVGGACTTHALESTYDGLNRVKTHTVKTSTPGVLTYTYAKGDVTTVLTPAPTGENAKTVQTEYDGLGRLVSVCAEWPTGGNGSGSCNQRSTASGYLTVNTFDALGRVTQIARNKQSGATEVDSCESYDLLGRPVAISVPESGGVCTSGSPTSGYTLLTYDTTHGGCTGVLGHLNEVTDPAGNVICYGYEPQLERMSSMTWAANKIRQFYYEVVSPITGVTLNNVKGRLSDVQYCDATCTTKYGGELFSYDVYGNVTDYYQNSSGLGSNSTIGNFYHITASRFDNGALKTLGGIPGVSTFTYGLDGEGRANTATSGSTSIVSGVIYDAASRPTEIDYASGDKDKYTWDASSSAMTQAQFVVGASNTTDTHAYTLNPNGTLKQLTITDNLSSTDTDTFTATHDDLMRITGYSGTHWSESYSYSNDSAGNVTKSGSVSFDPGYVASNNHYASGFGATYDANGFILHDPTLAQDYTWDGFGSMLTVASNPIINNVFGSMVQKTVGGTNTYFVKTPIGEVGTASSLTALSSMKIPLPGGSSITYDSAGNQQINHRDFRGSTVLRTNRAARTLVDVFCYGPMGEIYCGTTSASMYEGSFEDTSSGLADFNVTKYSGSWGRALQPSGGANGYVETNSPF